MQPCGWQNQYLLAEGVAEVMMCAARLIHFFNKAKCSGLGLGTCHISLLQ